MWGKIFAALFEGSESRACQPEKNKKTPTAPSYSPPISRATPTNKVSKVESYNKREVRKLASGRHSIEATLDLHGFTQREALKSLTLFLQTAKTSGKRHVLVITGKGQKRSHGERAFELGAPQPGILKQQVPLWLDDLSDIVVSYTTANIRHGGEGALYVRLRRLKS